MKIKEFYESINGDYNDILSRLVSDSLILRFIKKFKDDITYCELKDALRIKDYDKAFEACHKLKGVTSNLSFTDLYNSINQLTELLRPKKEVDWVDLIEDIDCKYNLVIRSIDLLNK